MPALTPGSGVQPRFDALSDWRDVNPRYNWRSWALTEHNVARPRFGRGIAPLGGRSGLRGQLFGAVRDYSPPRRTHTKKVPWGIPKTIEYFGESNLNPTATDTTLAASTAYQAQIAVTIVEQLNRNSFLSVKLVWCYNAANTATCGFTGSRVTCNINGGTDYTIDRSHASTAITGRSQSKVLETDVTDVFRDQWGADSGFTAKTVNVSIAVSTSIASNVNGQAPKLVITYAYDPSVQVDVPAPVPAETPPDIAQFRTKTIRIPVQSHGTTLTASQQEAGADGVLPRTNQLPDLDTFLPESDKRYLSVYLESYANLNLAATTSFTPFVQIGVAAEVARAQLIQGNWTGNTPFWRDHYSLNANFDATGQNWALSATSINWRCDLTARMPLICSFIVVTYAYNYTTTTDVICESWTPFENPSGDATNITQIAVSPPLNPPNRHFAIIDIPENPTVVRAAVVGQLVVGGAGPDLGINSGQGATRIYTSVSTIGEHTLMHRMDGVPMWDLRQGRNNVFFDFYNTGAPAVIRSHFFDGAYAHVLYTVALTNSKYEASPAAGGRDPNELCPADQLDAERCTRVICFQQKHEEENAFSTGMLGSYGKREPAVPMLGEIWKMSGALMEVGMWTIGTGRECTVTFSTGSDEPTGGGMVGMLTPRLPGVGTGYVTSRRWLPMTSMFNADSNRVGKLRPDRKRVYNSHQLATNSFLYYVNFYFTISNHRFELLGSMQENSNIAPVEDGTLVDIWALDDTLGTPNGDFLDIAKAELVARVPTFGKGAFGKTRFRFEVPDDYRLYFAKYAGLTLPAASPEDGPGNGNFFPLVVYTGLPGDQIAVETHTAQIHRKVSIAPQSFTLGAAPTPGGISIQTAQIHRPVFFAPQNFTIGMPSAGGVSADVEITTFPATNTTSTSATFTFTSINPAEYSVDGSPFAPASSPINLVGLSVAAHTITIRDIANPTRKQSFSWTVLSPSGDTTPPVITIVSPTPGTPLLRFVPIILRVTDNVALRRVVIFVRFADSEIWETVHDGDNFSPTFPAPDNTRTVIVGPNGYEYNLLRLGGWPKTPELHVVAIDTAGNMTVL